ncbi:hypothetical protein ABW20_dc0106153 [Dactylellina cionopaga]|nr:hypothetical protein ABW20_dc0106153 [Dactylellina cionopaga]
MSDSDAYKIAVLIQNLTSERILLAEKTCWKFGTGYNYWTGGDETPVLNIGFSGTSGMIRYRLSDGDTFSIAIGVHNYVRWCDIDVGDRGETLMQLHPLYYEEGARYDKLWDQAASASKTTAMGKPVSLTFDPAEGHELVCYIKVGEGECVTP